MKIDDYPLNKEIEETKKAIKELEKTNDIGAIILAESDLNGMLAEKTRCIDKQNLR